MSLRCGCSDQGDEVVFGQCRTCRPEPESVAAVSLQAELDRLEPLYHHVLSEDELHD